MAHEEEIKIPDIGGASNVDVIELLVKEGDKIAKETSLITLESDKASMEIPSPKAGVVKTLKVKVGDKVSEGDVILTIESEDTESQAKNETKEEKPAAGTEKVKEEAEQKPAQETKPQPAEEKKEVKEAETEPAKASSGKEGELPFATPAVRRMARELGVNLELVQGSGTKGRITKEDVQKFVKGKLSGQGQGSGTGLPQVASIDFTKFGEIELQALNKIKRLTGSNLHASWVNVPHVTQFDEADITELEKFRKEQGVKLKNSGANYKLTVLSFVIKVVANALKKYPQFNASLENGGENLILKKYFNIGFAVDTPNGLVVPVLRNVNKLSVLEIAEQMSSLSAKAREKGLSLQDMSGGCFTVSSLGGIGGTKFTPIINAPEVAILGLSRAKIKPEYIDGEFKPRLMLPLSLSYDHRVIDGAEGARFIRYLAESLEDIRTILL